MHCAGRNAASSQGKSAECLLPFAWRSADFVLCFQTSFLCFRDMLCCQNEGILTPYQVCISLKRDLRTAYCHFPVVTMREPAMLPKDLGSNFDHGQRYCRALSLKSCARMLSALRSHAWQRQDLPTYLLPVSITTTLGTQQVLCNSSHIYIICSPSCTG